MQAQLIQRIFIEKKKNNKKGKKILKLPYLDNIFWQVGQNVFAFLYLIKKVIPNVNYHNQLLNYTSNDSY
jgi:hypothetical protein